MNVVFISAPSEKMAEVINRTRTEAKAKIAKVCYTVSDVSHAITLI